jgi:hypothetical protein
MQPEYRAAYGGDGWQAGVWGCNPHEAFSDKRYPTAYGEVLHFNTNIEGVMIVGRVIQ